MKPKLAPAGATPTPTASANRKQRTTQKTKPNGKIHSVLFGLSDKTCPPRSPSESHLALCAKHSFTSRLTTFVTKQIKTIHRIIFIRLSQPPHKMLLHFDGAVVFRPQFQIRNNKTKKQTHKCVSAFYGLSDKT